MPERDARPIDASQKRSRILEAALEKFSEYGFSRTSMAEIAAAAGMSRPALYLHFNNKDEIFRATLESLLRSAFENALDALDPAALAGSAGKGDEDAIASQLTTFLQRYHGDLMEEFTTSKFADDFLVAKNSHAADIVDAAAKRARSGLTRYFNGLAARGIFDPESAGQPAARWIELILLSPFGLKQDQPSVAQYRRRLEALATSVAAGMTGGRAR